MPDYTTAVSSMQSYFRTQWSSATAIYYDDDKDDTPDDGSTWVRFSIRHDDGGQASIGSPNNNRFRQNGILIISVFAKSGQYAIDAREKAEDVKQIYDGLENSGITYYNASIREIGSDGRGWYQINVVVSFRYDTIT